MLLIKIWCDFSAFVGWASWTQGQNGSQWLVTSRSLSSWNYEYSQTPAENWVLHCLEDFWRDICHSEFTNPFHLKSLRSIFVTSHTGKVLPQICQDFLPGLSHKDLWFLWLSSIPLNYSDFTQLSFCYCILNILEEMRRMSAFKKHVWILGSQDQDWDMTVSFQAWSFACWC